MEAIKKRIQNPNPNLSNSLLDRQCAETETAIQINQPQMFVIDNTSHETPDTVSTLVKLIPINPIDTMNEPKHKSHHAISRTISPKSKYLTSINKKHKISSTEQGKAMHLLSHLFHFKSIHIKIFHMSWIILFISFFCYQSIFYLVAQISSDLHLTSTHISLSMSIQSFSMAIFSIIFGDLCDKIGARYSYIFVCIISLISMLLIILLSYNIISFLILSMCIGIIGSTFTITQYHITQFFSSKCVGIANGLSAGWGFFFALFAASNLHYICCHFNINWRYPLIIPFILLFISLFIYYFNTIDSPKGNISKEYISIKRICKIPKYKYIRIFKDYRIYILSLSFCISFGTEMTVLNYFINYISFSFKGIYSEFTINYLFLLICLINLFGRGFGGYLSDLLYLRYGIQGRVYCLFFTILFESLFLFLFAINNFHFGFTIFMFAFFILYAQISEGIVFAIVPNLPHQMYIGLCMGIIASGGAFGSMIGGFLFLHVPKYMSYQMAWSICSILVFISSFTILFIKFTKQEIQNDLRNTTHDFWTSIGEKYKDINDNNNKKVAGFVIH